MSYVQRCNIFLFNFYDLMNLTYRKHTQYTFSTLTVFQIIYQKRILCFVDRESLYNLVNKANLMHNFS